MDEKLKDVLTGPMFEELVDAMLDNFARSAGGNIGDDVFVCIARRGGKLTSGCSITDVQMLARGLDESMLVKGG